MPAPPPSLSTRSLRRHGNTRLETPAFHSTTPDVTTYNALGQRTAGSRSHVGVSNSLAWSYDGFGQLTKAAGYGPAGDRVYECDAIGNRKKSADSLILPGADNYVSNTLNQYTAVPLAPPAPVPGYDPDGNATAYPVPAAPTQNATLAWDGENRLITTTVAGTVTTARYDALSRRIAQTTGATREVTLYDGWNCIAEYEGAANTLHATNLWGTDLSGSPQGAGGVGGLLAVQMHTGPAIGINYPLYDGNGNITEYLNAAGAVVAHYKYDPFGRIYASSGTLKDAFPYRFSTKRLDAATGLYYYGYRYYDPVTGRWLSRDPIEEEGGVNTYAYVENDSINAIDPLGLVGIFPMGGQCSLCKDGKEMVKDASDISCCPEDMQTSRKGHKVCGKPRNEDGSEQGGGWIPPGWVIDAGAGFGDTWTFGITAGARGLMGVDNVNVGSGAYLGGAGLALGTQAALGGGFAVSRFPNSSLVGKGSAAFGRGGQFGAKGPLQSGSLRVGWGWKGTKKEGHDVFRVSWSKPSNRSWWNHFDFN